VVRNNHDNQALLGEIQQVFVDGGMAEEGAKLVEASRQEAIEIMNRGVLLAREGKLQEALDAMYQARTSLPTNVRVLFNFAFILISYMQKNGANDNLRTDARNALLQANKLEPGDKRFTQLMDALTKL
jgi:Flp pilus assembly protein TadD